MFVPALRRFRRISPGRTLTIGSGDASADPHLGQVRTPGRTVSAETLVFPASGYRGAR
jgi:hypothetical protein